MNCVGATVFRKPATCCRQPLLRAALPKNNLFTRALKPYFQQPLSGPLEGWFECATLLATPSLVAVRSADPPCVDTRLM